MAGFPDIIRATLPEAVTAFRGINVWLLRGPTASAIFVEATADSEVPEHAHGPQWGIVVHGVLDLTIGGKRRIYRRGEEYFIPAGVPHPARLKPGARVIDFFDDPDRYRPRA